MPVSVCICVSVCVSLSVHVHVCVCAMVHWNLCAAPRLSRKSHKNPKIVVVVCEKKRIKIFQLLSNIFFLISFRFLSCLFFIVCSGNIYLLIMLSV